jgi:hypothetical protein
MNKITVLIAAFFSLAAPLVSFAAMDHGDHSMMEMGNVAHQEVVDGVKVTFKVLSMKDHMKAIKMEMPKGIRETHHIMVEFNDARSGKPLSEGQVRVKVQNPDKSSQSKELVGMQGHFGADFELSRKGKYGVMSKFLLKDGKMRQSKFWYSVK